MIRPSTRKLAQIVTSSVLIVSLLTSCGSPDQPPPPLSPPVAQAIDQPVLQPVTDVELLDKRAYINKVSFAANKAKYFDLMMGKVGIDAAEMEMLQTNGFVVSDRRTWYRFIEAYAWIYWQDLPVLVTTDSLLHTVHQSYDDLLKDLEYNLLIPTLQTILEQSAVKIAEARTQNASPELNPIYIDVERFLEIARLLLQGGNSNDDVARGWIDVARAANTFEEVDLFGSSRTVDFSLFTPRGHYTGELMLENYFRAMTWLAQIDFRLLEFDMLTNEPILNPSQIAAAMILRDGLESSGQRAAWNQFNALFEALVGRSDNMVLSDLERFMTDARLQTPTSALSADPVRLLELLRNNDYGQQRITGQIIYRHIANSSDQPIPRPVSFLMMGQRFAIDSYVTGNVVFDRIMDDGQPVMRALPSPLDVMYALGNDRAVTHLNAELAEFPYGGNLVALRQQVDSAAPDFWQSSVYNRWLGMIRTLGTATTDEHFPETMRTSAWADKMLQTQLGSRAQLRHDTILYVKQSFTTAGVVCEYPAGYVEPYPAFYEALRNYAQSSVAALAGLKSASSNEAANAVQERASVYLQNLSEVAETLRVMSEKELRLEEFTEEETLFLRSIMVAKEPNVMGCAGPTFEDMWDGWYRRLFYSSDDNAAVIADIHTNPTTDGQHPLYPPRVLHAATGPIAPIFFIVNTDEGTAIYVGPAFTYFEHVTVGDSTTPAKRLTDDDWRQMLLTGNPYPAIPEWTSSFRVPSDSPPQILSLPRWEEMSQQPVDSPFSPLETP